MNEDYYCECGCELVYEDGEVYCPECCYYEDDYMDGDWDSGMSSAGFGTDEDYDYYGDY